MNVSLGVRVGGALVAQALSVLAPRQRERGEREGEGDEDGAPLPEAAETSYVASLDPIEKIRYADLNDVTDADINVYAATGRKA